MTEHQSSQLKKPKCLSCGYQCVEKNVEEEMKIHEDVGHPIKGNKAYWNVQQDTNNPSHFRYDSKDAWYNFMQFTGNTDQFKGREYNCPICNKLYWSAWGHARRHFEKHDKELSN